MNGLFDLIEGLHHRAAFDTFDFQAYLLCHRTPRHRTPMGFRNRHPIHVDYLEASEPVRPQITRLNQYGDQIELAGLLSPPGFAEFLFDAILRREEVRGEK